MRYLSLIFIMIFSLNAKELKNEGVYKYVQVLAIRDFNRAKKVMKKLDNAGYKYVVRDSIVKNEVYYRVVVGPFENIKEEQQKLHKLLRIKESFILTYKEPTQTTVDLPKLLNEEYKPKVEKKVKKEEIKVPTKKSEIYIIEDANYKKRIDKIVNLSFEKNSFDANKGFICKELEYLISKNYAPAILLQASNYIKGDECFDQDLDKAIETLSILKDNKEIPESIKKFSKELLAETFIKTETRENLQKAKKILENLLVDSIDNKYSIYLYKRLAFIEYTLKEYKYMNLWLEEAGKLGDLESQLTLGKNYLHALGTKQDIEKAKYWLSKCLKKNASCADEMGSLYLNLNLDTPPNISKAFEYFEIAKDLGSFKASELVENRESIMSFYLLMHSSDIQFKLVQEYLFKYLQDKEVKNLSITSINEIDKKTYDVYISFALDGVEKLAKMKFFRNKHDYWITTKFQIADSLLELK